MAASSFGKAVCLALLSMFLVTCGDELGGGRGELVQRSEIKGQQARAFYEARGWSAAWDDNSAERLQEALANAPAHGLKAEMFLQRGLPQDRTGRELALTNAALR